MKQFKYESFVEIFLKLTEVAVFVCLKIFDAL